MPSIDKEAVELIVDIYSQMNTIKRLQQEAEYSQIENFIHSGEQLSNKMNDLFSEVHQNNRDYKQVLNNIKDMLQNLSNQNCKSFENKHVQEISEILESLQQKIHLLEKHLVR